MVSFSVGQQQIVTCSRLWPAANNHFHSHLSSNSYENCNSSSPPRLKAHFHWLTATQRISFSLACYTFASRTFKRLRHWGAKRAGVSSEWWCSEEQGSDWLTGFRSWTSAAAAGGTVCNVKVQPQTCRPQISHQESIVLIFVMIMNIVLLYHVDSAHALMVTEPMHTQLCLNGP